MIAMIPPDASVSASNQLAIHLARRRQLYLFPTRARNVDFVLVETWPGYPYRVPDYGPQAHVQAVQAARSEPGVRVLEQGSYLLVDRRGVR
jgi:hypothetical protein